MDNITRMSIMIIILAILFIVGKGFLWLLRKLGYVLSKKRFIEIDKKRAENIRGLEEKLGIRVYKESEGKDVKLEKFY